MNGGPLEPSNNLSLVKIYSTFDYTFKVHSFFVFGHDSDETTYFYSRVASSL